MSNLPKNPDDKLSYLELAARHGDEIRKRTKIGKATKRLRRFVGRHGDLTLDISDDYLSIKFGEYVNWQVTINHEEIILGYSASGYGELMEALGIDFAGNALMLGN